MRETWSDLGPEWDPAFLDGPRERAKQLDCLAIDLEFCVRWADAMSALVDRELPDQEFTAARMHALHEWERARKREQKSLHYRYDPLRRSRRLVERDTAATLERARTQIAAWKAKLATAKAAFDAANKPADAAPERPPRPERAPRPPRPARPTTLRRQALHPALASLDADVRDMYARLAPVDVATTSDDDLRTAWAEHNPGMSAELIEAVIAEINGTPSATGRTER